MKLKLLIIAILAWQIVSAQSPVNSRIFISKEFSKDIAVYKAKSFLIESVLGPSNGVIRFEVDALAAASSGELTYLVYKCEEKNKEGLILGFYGNTWNDSGMHYKAFAFKDISKQKALDLLNKIEQTVDDQYKYLSKDGINNNVYFQYEDMNFLVYTTGLFQAIKIRVFWNDFDSELDLAALKRTKRRLELTMEK